MAFRRSGPSLFSLKLSKQANQCQIVTIALRGRLKLDKGCRYYGAAYSRFWSDVLVFRASTMALQPLSPILLPYKLLKQAIECQIVRVALPGRLKLVKGLGHYGWLTRAPGAMY